MPVFHGSRFHHLAGPSRPIEGAITDRDTGRPIAEVALKAYVANHETSATARTDANGRYRLLGLPTEGKLQINVQPGKGQPYLRQSVERRLRSADEFPGRLDIPLAHGILVRGRTIDENGHETRASGDGSYYMPYSDNPHPRSLPSALRRLHRVRRRRARWLVRAGRRAGPRRRGPRMPGRSSYTANRGPNSGGIPPTRAATTRRRIAGLVRAEDFHATVKIDPKPGAAELRRDVVLEPGLSVRGKLVDPRRPPGHRCLGIPPDVDRPGRHRRRAAGALMPPSSPPSAWTPDRPRQLWFLHRQRNLGRVVILPDPAAGPDREPITVVLQPAAALSIRPAGRRRRPRQARLPGVRRHPAPADGGRTRPPDVAHRRRRPVPRITGLLPGLTYTLGGDTVPPTGVGEITVRIGEVKDLGDLKK